MAGIPPPPPLPPGTVVPQQRVAPPPMPVGKSLPRSKRPGTHVSAASPMAVGMGYANTAAAAAGGAVPPPPPPLPPGTVVPQSRPIPPAMPSVMISQLRVVPQAQGATSVPVVAAALPPAAPVRKVLERPADGKKVQFPRKVAYYEGAEDIAGDKQKGILRMKGGQMIVVYKTEDPHWWLGKVGDEVGWIDSHTLQEINPQAPGRRPHRTSEDTNPRTWDSKKQQGAQMTATELDMEKTDFSITNATTFDHHGSKIATFFIQVSGVRKNVKGQGDIWVVAKTLKAFNRLRVAWEEDYGTTSIPVEPPPARWEECSEADWKSVKGAALRKFLEEVKQWPNLKHSQDLKHFFTTDRVNLSGGMISKKTMKPYLDAWVKTSSEPAWTLKIAPIPSKEIATGAGGKPSHKADKSKKAAIPGLRAGDESFGQLTSRRPKLRRSGVFRQLSALAAVTKQEAQLEKNARRGWTHAGLKLQLLIQGADACSLRRRSERNVFYKYYAEDVGEDGDVNGGISKALSRRAGYNQMKPQLRYNLEKVVYGRVENLNRENGTEYAVYAKHKEQEKLQKDSGVAGQHKRGALGDGGEAAGGQHKKNSMFHLEALAERLEHATKIKETPSKQDPTLDRCQYVSKINGRFTMPIAAQLMALDELGREELDRFLVHVGETNRPKIERMKEMDSFLEDKRVRCHQLVELLDRMHTPDERLLVVLTCCVRLTDAVEADDQGLFKDLEGAVDALNLKRVRLAVDVIVAEAQAEDASRGSRKAAREVHADVLRARKALGFLSKAVEKIRSGTIKTEMFEELKERLEAAADAAHEEYCDAVKRVKMRGERGKEVKVKMHYGTTGVGKESGAPHGFMVDAKPATEYADQAAILMESAEKLYADLDELGTGVRERQGVKVIRNGDVDLDDDTEESLLVSALEVLLTIACNAHELASRAADNARSDLQVALEEVANAEKIIRRVELEERRARIECEAAEENEDEDPLSMCAFVEWADDMKEHAMENLAAFRKDGKYRLHLDKTTSIRGSEDMLMMATLLSRVQLLRDLKALKVEARAEEQKRQEQLMQQASSKRRKKSVLRRQGAGPARHAPMRQQSSIGPESSHTRENFRAAPMRQQSDVFSVDEELTPRKGRGKSGKAQRGRAIGEIEDQVDEEDEDRGSSGEAGGSGDTGMGSSDEDGSPSSSEVDSVFGSDLNADDDDLGPMRRSAGLRGSAPTNRQTRRSGGPRDSLGARRATHAGGAGGASGGEPGSMGLIGSMEETTRRHDRMRQSLIGHTLGKRGSIGTKSNAKSLAPLTPRHDRGRRGRPTSGRNDSKP